LDPSWVILAVESIHSRPKGIEPEWKRVAANTFEMEPILLNPSDVFNVMIWAARSESEQQNASPTKPSPTWSARVLSMPGIREIGPRPTDIGYVSYRLSYLSSYHSEWSFIAFVGIWLGLFVFALNLISAIEEVPRRIWSFLGFGCLGAGVFIHCGGGADGFNYRA
jgi:hypothetical protein